MVCKFHAVSHGLQPPRAPAWRRKGNWVECIGPYAHWADNCQRLSSSMATPRVQPSGAFQGGSCLIYSVSPCDGPQQTLLTIPAYPTLWTCHVLYASRASFLKSRDTIRVLRWPRWLVAFSAVHRKVKRPGKCDGRAPSKILADASDVFIKVEPGSCASSRIMAAIQVRLTWSKHIIKEWTMVIVLNTSLSSRIGSATFSYEHRFLRLSFYTIWH